MDSNYPVEPYKPKRDEIRTHLIMRGKMGNSIEVEYLNETREFVTLTFKNNRGNVKAAIEVPIEEALKFANVITVTSEYYSNSK